MHPMANIVPVGMVHQRFDVLSQFGREIGEGGIGTAAHWRRRNNSAPIASRDQ